MFIPIFILKLRKFANQLKVKQAYLLLRFDVYHLNCGSIIYKLL